MAEISNAPGDVGASAFRFVSRNVSAEEAAAVTAVLLTALDEEASAAAFAAELGRDPWVRSARALRAPIDVGPGNWRRSAR